MTTTIVSLLAPWLLQLETCMSVSDPSNGVVTLQVCDYLVTVPNAITPATSERLGRLRETLELFYMGFNTASSSDQHKLLEHCKFSAPLHSIASFELDFQAGPCGDTRLALKLLRTLLDPEHSREPSFEFHATRALLLQRRPSDAVHRDVCPRYRICLNPPFQVALNPLTIVLIAPSRNDTIAYYNELLSTITAISQSGVTHCIDSVQLDLSHLDMPGDVLAALHEILALPLRLLSLMLNIGYSLSESDRKRLIEALNQQRACPLECLRLEVLDTRLGDNFAALLPYLSTFTQYHHIELVEGNVNLSPASTSSQAPLSSHQRESTKIAQVAETTIPPVGYTSTREFCGPASLMVQISDRTIATFLRELPSLGTSLRSLDIRVSDTINCAVHLGSIVRSCPHLHRLLVHGSGVVGIDELCGLIENSRTEMAMLVLRQVVLYDRDPLKVLVQMLSDPRTKVARKLKTLEIVQRDPLTTEVMEAFEQALAVNERLEVLTLGFVDISAMRLLQFDSEPLHSLKYAFLRAAALKLRHEPIGHVERV